MVIACMKSVAVTTPALLPVHMERKVCCLQTFLVSREGTAQHPRRQVHKDCCGLLKKEGRNNNGDTQ